ncbi:uncharacterized protein DFL_008791 [Arthrobotrys flagrans]|uniref:Lethal giant larvae (Lgl)-like C-terminal domain-containing protein n=1 Tax=Arthrobotrys flagrans TaxID=97331 RepID=A0A436ZPR9_ARTFL|nr:hypothetical protein DFL_008791 [Arthrobotrys flagrans]
MASKNSELADKLGRLDLKDRKMPFLRRKSEGEINLSGNISSDDLALDDVKRYGFEGKPSALAYDPVQSLVAVGTNETDSSPGAIYIFGRSRVSVKYSLPKKTSVKHVRIHDDRLLVIDAKHELHHFNISTHTLVCSWSPPGAVSVICTDPASDFIFLGLQNGEIVAFDVDGDIAAPFKIPNLWREHSPKAVALPVVSIAMHPRDLGTLLIAYLEGALLFSLKQNKATFAMKFELKPGAPGSDMDPATIKTLRTPKLSNAIFNPSGTTVLTTYEDGCMAFWSTTDGRLLTARTLQDFDVHLPAPVMAGFGGGPALGAAFTLREPFHKVAWCCSNNIDDTCLLVSGGNNVGMAAKGLTLIEFGVAPNNITSSWKQITEHLGNPKRQRFLPVPHNIDVVDFCMLPKTSPYHAGSHDPSAVMVLFTNGDIATLRYPDGEYLSPAGMMHPSMALVHPKPFFMEVAPISREKWLGMVAIREKPAAYFKGGADAKRMTRRYQDRSIACTIHKDATVRVWDLGHNDEIENPEALELDVGVVVGKPGSVKVSAVSASQATAEMAVGLESGEVVIYRWGRNKSYNGSLQSPTSPAVGMKSSPFGQLRDIASQADPTLKEGLLPLYLMDAGSGAVKTTAVSDVGFVAIGYDSGTLTIVDLRGPTVIYSIVISTVTKDVNRIKEVAKAAAKRSSLTSIAKDIKRGSVAVASFSKELPGQAKRTSFAGFRKTGSLSSSSKEEKEKEDKTEYVVTMAFSVMTVGEDEFSSICLHVGTNLKNVMTFKILPDGSRFVVSCAGGHPIDNPPLTLIPINSETGASARATPDVVAGLRQGKSINGFIICVTSNQARIILPPEDKENHKSWDEMICIQAGVAELPDKGIVLVCVYTTGRVRVFSIPALKEIGAFDLPAEVDRVKLSNCRITREGFISAWTSHVEFGLFYMWGTGKQLHIQPKDILYNPDIAVPARPTISGLQWISGTQHVSAGDFDLLIGGPDRPPSQKHLNAEQKANGGDKSPTVANGNSVFGNMANAFNARTQNLQNFQDNMQNLENTTAEFAKATSKFIESQKRKAVLGGAKSLF